MNIFISNCARAGYWLLRLVCNKSFIFNLIKQILSLDFCRGKMAWYKADMQCTRFVQVEHISHVEQVSDKALCWINFDISLYERVTTWERQRQTNLESQRKIELFYWKCSSSPMGIRSTNTSTTAHENENELGNYPFKASNPLLSIRIFIHAFVIRFIDQPTSNGEWMSCEWFGLSLIIQ